MAKNGQNGTCNQVKSAVLCHDTEGYFCLQILGSYEWTSFGLVLELVWAVLSPVIAEGPGPTISVIAVMKLSPNDARGAWERHYRARIFFKF